MSASHANQTVSIRRIQSAYHPGSLVEPFAALVPLRTSLFVLLDVELRIGGRAQDLAPAPGLRAVGQEERPLVDDPDEAGGIATRRDIEPAAGTAGGGDDER